MNDYIALVPVTIEVTLEMLNEGVRKSCGGCPLALALNAKLKPEYRKANMGTEVWFVCDWKSPTPLPIEAQHFISWFDGSFEGVSYTETDLKALAPLVFTLMVPQQYVN